MRTAWLVGCSGAMLAGCSLPGQRADFHSIDPAERTLAAVEAAEKPSDESTRELIEMLGSDDPGERMLAIAVLKRQTGESFGYEHSGPERGRREAIERWRGWADSSRSSSSAGVSAGR